MVASLTNWHTGGCISRGLAIALLLPSLGICSHFAEGQLSPQHLLLPTFSVPPLSAPFMSLYQIPSPVLRSSLPLLTLPSFAETILLHSQGYSCFKPCETISFILSPTTNFFSGKGTKGHYCFFSFRLGNYIQTQIVTSKARYL